jgi:hypothetical protein
MNADLRPWGDLPGASLPLLRATGDHDYPYWYLGTGFLVSFANRLYILTAKHCLRTQDPNLLRIPARVNGPELIPISRISRADDSDPLEDYTDVVVLTVAPEYSHPSDPGVVEPFAIEGHWTSRFSAGQALSTRGFPYDGTRTLIDYEEKTIHLQAASFGADYSEAGLGPFMHLIRFLDTVPITNFNSMSGSPVFVNPSRSIRQYTLAGMLLRAGGRLGYFLDAGVLALTLDKVVKAWEPSR